MPIRTFAIKNPKKITPYYSSSDTGYAEELSLEKELEELLLSSSCSNSMGSSRIWVLNFTLQVWRKLDQTSEKLVIGAT
jgi:hypothetical protein